MSGLGEDTSFSMWLSPTWTGKPPAGSLRVDPSPPAGPLWSVRASRTQAGCRAGAREPRPTWAETPGRRHLASQWERQASRGLPPASHPPIHIRTPEWSSKHRDKATVKKGKTQQTGRSGSAQNGRLWPLAFPARWAQTGSGWNQLRILQAGGWGRRAHDHRPAGSPIGPAG